MSDAKKPPQLAGLIESILKETNAREALESIPEALMMPIILAETLDRHGRGIVDAVRAMLPLANAHGMSMERLMRAVLSAMIADCIQCAEAYGISPDELRQCASALLTDKAEPRMDFDGVVGTETDTEYS